MPYSRGYKKRSYGRRRYTGYRKKATGGFGGMSLASAWKTAKWAAQQAWKIRGLVNSEMKKVDFGLSATNITNAGAVLDLTGIGQGDTENARTGNSIYVRALNFKGWISRTTSGDAVQAVRIIVFQDTQQVGDTAPTVNSVLSGVNVYAHLNSANAGRYKILHNKVLTLDTARSLSMPFEINIPMRHHMRYNGTSSTDIQKGGLYIGYLSSQGTANYPVFNAECRLSFHDN